jgi:predicted DNA-binding WGR domain protein
MASRSDWSSLRRDFADDDAWDEAIDDLDRDHEHSGYYDAQRAARDLSGHEVPDEDDVHARHAYADNQEALAGAAREYVDHDCVAI